MIYLSGDGSPNDKGIMETREIRLQNFLALATGYAKINKFCEAVELSPSYFSQVKSGAKAIGDNVARRTERLLGLPNGWLDVPQSEEAKPQQMPADTLGVAYAIEALPERLRERVKMLVLELSTELASLRMSREAVVQPFAETEHARQGSTLPAPRKKQR